MKKFFSFSSSTITTLFSFFFLLTCYFSIFSPNLVIGDNPKYGQSTTLVTTYFILSSIVIFVGIITFDNVKKIFRLVFIKHKFLSSVLMLFGVILLQIIFIFYVHPEVGWDVGMLHYAQANKSNAQNPEVIGYFSSNTNNLFIELLMLKLAILFGNHTWIFFDYFTLFLVDLSVLLNLLTISVIKIKKLSIAIYSHALFLLFFPSIIIPYSDTWVLPLVSGMLLIYFLILYKKNFIIRVFLSVTLGLTLVVTYNVKPSAIIPIIAMTIIELLFMVKSGKIKITLKFIAIIILIITSSILSEKFIQQKVCNQTFIRITKGREVPAIHFISMGVSGEGGYNAKDALMMSILQTKEERIKYSEDKLVERLKGKGVFGYIKFLLQKHSNNTSDGTFGWLKEGNFFKESSSPSNTSISGKIKNYFLLYGTHIEDFRMITQIIYIFFMILILFGGNDKEKNILFLKLCILGGFLYLLVFEGGRSRYLIQFFPMFMLLFSLSFSKSFERIKRFFICEVNEEF